MADKLKISDIDVNDGSVELDQAAEAIRDAVGRLPAEVEVIDLSVTRAKRAALAANKEMDLAFFCQCCRRL